MTVLEETKYSVSSKCLEAKGPSCVTPDIYPYANIPKSTKGSNREIQTTSDCINKTSAQATVFFPYEKSLDITIV